MDALFWLVTMNPAGCLLLAVIIVASCLIVALELDRL